MQYIQTPPGEPCHYETHTDDILARIYWQDRHQPWESKEYNLYQYVFKGNPPGTPQTCPSILAPGAVLASAAAARARRDLRQLAEAASGGPEAARAEDPRQVPRARADLRGPARVWRTRSRRGSCSASPARPWRPQLPRPRLGPRWGRAARC